ncbi:hypothetical protein [Magnetospirillum aberrantis]|uniref:Tetratricopeptide repeat protein n=1 Tax=Magnetospirillum aberrantis SpK TaxID=908842 RepID=A0A7C9QR55_9PROT|nr:hypothetical protein [Magnetospirillum aberrantis]NFV78580.1 hypothetical protein [Magnetospirillum aberrantis SpK]
MFDNNPLPLDLPPAARAEMAAAVAAWDDEPTAASHVAAALTAAPDSLGVRIGAYKFYLYRHRLEQAVVQARVILAQAARRQQLPHDWRDVAADHAAFDSLEPWPRLFLQALVALGYGLLRLGLTEEGEAALVKAAELDPADRLGAKRLLELSRREPDEDEDS